MSSGCSDSAANVASDDEWDAFLQHGFLCHPEQSSPYAANRAEYGYRCDRIVVRENGAIVGGAQLLVWTAPIGNLAYIFRGPVLAAEEPRLMREVVRQLEQTAKARAYSSVQVDLFPDHHLAYQVLREAGFAPAPSKSQGKESFLVPLAFSDEELMDRMDKKVAYYVRRATREGVDVRSEEGGTLDDFYEMHEETAMHHGFLRFPREYFASLWRLFGTAGKVRCFVAYHDCRPLAGIFNVIVGRTMYYNWGGMSRTPEAKKMQVNYLLHMKAVAWARSHGCTHYDLMGTQPFKKQFAVETVFWPGSLLKCYGPAGALRWKMQELIASKPSLRRMVTKAARLLEVRQEKRMPW